jgi:hypothetical protein
MIAAAIRRFGFKGSDNNEADAYLLWCMARHAYGHPVARVPLVQSECVGKVGVAGDQTTKGGAVNTTQLLRCTGRTTRMIEAAIAAEAEGRPCTSPRGATATVISWTRRLRAAGHRKASRS